MKLATKTLVQKELKSLGVGALIAVIGALATYVLQAIPSVNLGEWTPVTTALLAIGANALRKLIPILAGL